MELNDPELFSLLYVAEKADGQEAEHLTKAAQMLNDLIEEIPEPSPSCYPMEIHDAQYKMSKAQYDAHVSLLRKLSEFWMDKAALLPED